MQSRGGGEGQASRACDWPSASACMGVLETDWGRCVRQVAECEVQRGSWGECSLEETAAVTFWRGGISNSGG
jgi:hypothetical protein